MSRRVKATVADLPHDYDIIGRVYCERDRAIKGTRYVLYEDLTDSERETLSKFKNVVISKCSFRYAPEIQHDTVVITDKCISREVMEVLK